MSFLGYVRADGRVGVRNHVLVMSSVSCANGVVNEIGRKLPQVKTITHTEGCGRGIQDLGISTRTLMGIADNPNVGAVVFIGLGCEYIKAPRLAENLKKTGKPVAFLDIQDNGGSVKTAQRGVEIAQRFLAGINEVKRSEVGWEKLVVGLECGGSDAMSGVTANPLVGAVTDKLVELGATVILSETTEMIGATEVLVRRAVSPEVGEKIRNLVSKQRALTKQWLGPFADSAISPGNMDGGITSIQEKSLGCIIKGGSTPVVDVLDYAVKPTQRGLVLMDTPGSDIFSMTGMVAGGAVMVLFTTGRGTPAGFPIAPVIKIATNTEMFNRMIDDMDVNAGALLSEEKDMETMANELFELVKRTAHGELTKAEKNLQDIFSIHTVGPAF